MKNMTGALAFAAVLGVGIGVGQSLLGNGSAPLLGRDPDPPAVATPATAPAPATAASISTPEETVIAVTKRATPAVVSIRSRSGAGSGVIISADGVILTNEHVVRGSRVVEVGLASGDELRGEVLG